MIAKCANPECSKPFRYLHEGRLFVRSPESKADSGHRDDRVVFVWLSRRCSVTLTLRFEKGLDGAIVPQIIRVDRSPSPLWNLGDVT
jgi:hypothetical protein